MLLAPSRADRRAATPGSARPGLKFLLVNPTSPLWRARRPGSTRGARAFRFSMLSSLYVAASLPSTEFCSPASWAWWR